jgi:hypothetical protein
MYSNKLILKIILKEDDTIDKRLTQSLYILSRDNNILYDWSYNRRKNRFLKNYMNCGHPLMHVKVKFQATKLLDEK